MPAHRQVFLTLGLMIQMNQRVLMMIDTCMQILSQQSILLKEEWQGGNWLRFISGHQKIGLLLGQVEYSNVYPGFMGNYRIRQM